MVIDRPDWQSGQLGLIPDYIFLITNWSQSKRTAVESLTHYRSRGNFAGRFGEFNQAIGVHLSSQPFADNEATVLPAMPAFNLASLRRIELEDSLGGCWDLRRFQSSVRHAGARIIKHAGN